MWILFSLLAAFTAGIVVVLSKAGLKNVDSTLGFAVEAVCILIISWSAVAAQGGFGKLARIDRRSWIFLLTAGILTCLSSLFSFHSLKIGHASRTSSLERLSLVFSLTFSIIFLKDKVNWQLITGALLMIGGAIVVALSDQTS